MDNDRELTFTTLSGAANTGEQTFIVEQPVSNQSFPPQTELFVIVFLNRIAGFLRMTKTIKTMVNTATLVNFVSKTDFYPLQTLLES